MSAYSETSTEFKDGELLIEALTAMGYKPRNCIGNQQALESYTGDYRTPDGQGHTSDMNKAMKADIIIPRKQVGGSSNDIGFVKGADGKYKAIISDYDSTKHNVKWLNEVKVNVADAGIMRTAKKAGMRIAGRKVNKGQIVYEFIKV